MAYILRGRGVESARTRQSTPRGREGGKNPPKSHYVVCERPLSSSPSPRDDWVRLGLLYARTI